MDRKSIMFAGRLCLIIAAASTGCSSPSADDATPDEKLVGAWVGKIQIDQAKLEETVAKKTKSKLGASIAKKVIGAMTKKLESARMTLEFKSDGTFTGSTEGIPGKEKKVAGTWKIVSVSGNDVVVEFTKEDQSEQTTLTFYGKDEFALQSAAGVELPEGVGFRFHRAP